MKDKIVGIFSSIYFGAAAGASILGLVLFLLPEYKVLSYVGIGFILSSLLLVLYKINSLFSRDAKIAYPKGYKIISIAGNLRTENGRTYTYRMQKFVQSKLPVLTRLKQRMNWTGSKIIDVSSDFQELKKISASGKANDPDVFSVRFKPPLLYNQCDALTIQTELDDPNELAKPHLEFEVATPIRLLSWHVELRHASTDYGKNPAKLIKSPIKGGAGSEEVIKQINYDPRSFSYRCRLADPEVGFHYRLVWEKPATNGHN